MLDPDVLRELEELRWQMDLMAEETRRLRRENKALRAEASAVLDLSFAQRRAAKGELDAPSPPIPTHPPSE